MNRQYQFIRVTLFQFHHKLSELSIARKDGVGSLQLTARSPILSNNFGIIRFPLCHDLEAHSSCLIIRHEFHIAARRI